MKSKIYKFNPVIYPIPILVTKSYEEEELKKMFHIVDSSREVHIADDEFSLTPTGIAKTIPVLEIGTDKVYSLTITRDVSELTDGVIAHEALHYATFIGQWTGLPPCTYDNDEVYSYIIQWATDCILSVLSDAQKKMNGYLFKHTL